LFPLVLALLPVGCWRLGLFSLRRCSLLRRLLPTFDYSGRRRCCRRLCRWLLLPPGVLLIFQLLPLLRILLLFQLLSGVLLLLLLLLLPGILLIFQLLLLLGILLLFQLLLLPGILLIFQLLLLLGILLLFQLLRRLPLARRSLLPFDDSGLWNGTRRALGTGTHRRLNAFDTAHIDDANRSARRRRTLTDLLDIGRGERAAGIPGQRRLLPVKRHGSRRRSGASHHRTALHVGWRTRSARGSVRPGTENALSLRRDRWSA